MMKMDGRNSVKCQNWKKRDIMIILKFDLNEKKTKHSTVLSPTIKKTKNVNGGKIDTERV